MNFKVKGEKKPLTAKFYGTDKKLPIKNRQEMDEILKNLENCKYEITEVKKARGSKMLRSRLQPVHCSRSGQDSEFFHTENHASGTAVI